MPRKRRIAKTRTKLDIAPGVWRWMNDEGPLDRDDPDFFDVFILEGDLTHRRRFDQETQLTRLWKSVRQDLLQAWAAKKPGTRPSLWWHFDAPRQPFGMYPDCFWDGMLAQPRKRLGGQGKPPWEAGLAYVPTYSYGLPYMCAWQGIDPEDPPVYESEASYLKRNGLLLPGENRSLTAADFKPVSILMETNDGCE